mmetsp:Transcript_8404/g.25020  ORF Transcript_8404/g.25020 Transcript_8404/m.25020 type:complete len:643 (+) Transcript_8404:1-1929(+)
MCASCNEELAPGASVVKFGGLSLHPKCYRCAGPCKMQLAVSDKVYTHHAAPWCKRCYSADVERECWRCKENIKFDASGKMAGVGAGAISFHKECYMCKSCNKPFSIGDTPGEKCFEVAGEHFCEAHAREAMTKEDKKGKKAKQKQAKKEAKKDKAAKVKPNKCGKCKKKDPPPTVLSGGKHWHEGCQPCKVCKKSVKDQEYIVERGFAYCSGCAERVFMVKCAGCNFRIEAPAAGETVKHVKLPFGTFHMQCFVCTVDGCPNALIVDGASAAFMHQNMPYCADHYKAKVAEAKAKRKVEDARARAEAEAAAAAGPAQQLVQQDSERSAPLSLADYSGYQDMHHHRGGGDSPGNTYGITQSLLDSTPRGTRPLAPSGESDYAEPEPLVEGEVLVDGTESYGLGSMTGAASAVGGHEDHGDPGGLPPEQPCETYECPVPLQPDTYASIDEYPAALQPDTYASIDQRDDVGGMSDYLSPTGTLPTANDRRFDAEGPPMPPEPTYEATYDLPDDADANPADNRCSLQPVTLTPGKYDKFRTPARARVDSDSAAEPRPDSLASHVSGYDKFRADVDDVYDNTPPKVPSDGGGDIYGINATAEEVYGLSDMPANGMLSSPRPDDEVGQDLDYDNFGAGAGLLPIPGSK